MSRIDACLKLLRLGSLTAPELREFTRWPRGTCNDAVRQLEQRGQVRRVGVGRSTRWEAIGA